MIEYDENLDSYPDNLEWVAVDIPRDIFKVHLEKNLCLPIFEAEDGEGLYGFGAIDPELFLMYANLYDFHTTGEVLPYGGAEAVKTGWFRTVRREDMLEDPEFRFSPLDVPLWDHTPETGKIIMTWIDR